jgi:hypothetical protein
VSLIALKFITAAVIALCLLCLTLPAVELRAWRRAR